MRGLQRRSATWLPRSGFHPKRSGGSPVLAAQTGRTKAFYLREIIDRGLEDIEDYYLAADVLARIRKGQEQVNDAADVRKELGLEN